MDTGLPPPAPEPIPGGDVPAESASATSEVASPAGPDTTGPAVAPGDPSHDPGALALGAVERLAIGRTPAVALDDPWAEAGRKVLRFHLARMLARVPGVLTGDDPEDVHAMRVAARRMRAGWRLFGDGFERETSRRYRRDLRALGSRLGAVRDLDVLIEILVAHGARRTQRERSRLDPLLVAWQAERGSRRTALVGYLASGDFAAFVDEYEALVTTAGMAALPVAPHAPDLVRHRIAPALWTSYASAWAYDRVMPEADVATLHELRIAGKWLRYGLEFVREPLEPEATMLIGRVVALQDHLGALHDVHVAADLARAFVGETPQLRPGERETIGRFAHHLDKVAARLMRRAGGTWAPVAEPAYRRALGRALARL